MKKQFIGEKHTRSSAGFTLIELLVVVAIISVLIAILLPSLAKAKQQANSLRCSASLRSIALALKLYAEDYNGAYPFPGIGAPTTKPWPTTGYFNSWVAYTMVYTGDVTEDNATNSWRDIYAVPPEPLPKLWDCPDNPLVAAASGDASNYAYNRELAYDFLDSTFRPLPTKPYNMPRQAELLAAIDAGPYNDVSSHSTIQAGYGQRSHYGPWHNDGYNAAFLDGHVSWYRKLTLSDGSLELPWEFFPQGRIWLGQND